MGGINASGLITGIDSGALIQQLMALERQPILRYEQRIAELESERGAVRDLRTQLTTLRNQAQDFRLINVFDAFQSTSSEETVLTSEVSSSTPVTGAFDVDILQLATATTAQSSAVLGSPINTSVALNSSGIATEATAGTFSINGVEFTIDPATQSLDAILGTINSSGAGVTATYDAVTDKVTFENTTAGDTSLINFQSGTDEGESNFLNIIAVSNATQSTGGSGSTIATSTRNLGAVDATVALNTASFANGAVTAGTFSINGVSITIDPATDALVDIIGAINSSEAEVTASYDSATDTIRLSSDVQGSRTIRFGGASDTSNFLNIVNLDTATQTAGKDSQFTINNGPTQTRNTNDVSDAISGVTLNFRSVGTSTVTVSSDDDAIVEDVQEFITEFNTALTQITDLTANGASLAGDSGIRAISTYLLSNIFNEVSGLGGDYSNLLEIGISSGEDFSSTTTFQLEMDEESFREALREDRTTVEQLFSNNGNNGIADIFYGYLDDITKASGFLNARSKSNGTIDQQIQSLNDQIDRVEYRIGQKEERLRRQFSNLETMSNNLQSQSASLGSLGGGLSYF